jgi:hypothetical protein
MVAEPVVSAAYIKNVEMVSQVVGTLYGSGIAASFLVPRCMRGGGCMRGRCEQYILSTVLTDTGGWYSFGRRRSLLPACSRQIRPMIEFGVTTVVWSTNRHKAGWMGDLVAYPLPPHPASFFLHGIMGVISLWHVLVYQCVLYGVVRGFGARFAGKQGGIISSCLTVRPGLGKKG